MDLSAEKIAFSLNLKYGPSDGHNCATKIAAQKFIHLKIHLWNIFTNTKFKILSDSFIPNLKTLQTKLLEGEFSGDEATL